MKTVSVARLRPFAQKPSNRASALVLGILTILSLPSEAATLKPAQIGLQSDKNIYHDGWIDFNKNVLHFPCCAKLWWDPNCKMSHVNAAY